MSVKLSLFQFSVLLIANGIILSAHGMPIVIGHRGASGYRPENTLASYDLAISMGADFIEADLVSTKDHVLVASHNPHLTSTTDVADHPEFANRFVTKNVSGESYTGYFVSDFTLNELRTLRNIEAHPNSRGTNWNNIYGVPTLQEILRFVKAKEKELGRRIGVYLETKHPAYFRSIGLPLENVLAQVLSEFGYTTEKDPIFVESFESNLLLLSQLTKVRLVQLVSGSEGDAVQYDTQRLWRDIISRDGLREISTYAAVVAPHKTCIFRKSESGELTETNFVKDAHDFGLEVHVWTFRKDAAEFETPEKRIFFGPVEEELVKFFAAGIDGVFTDHPDVGVSVRDHSARITTMWSDWRSRLQSEFGMVAGISMGVLAYISYQYSHVPAARRRKLSVGEKRRIMLRSPQLSRRSNLS
eukprot:TRINITY_DN1843_c0_g1_i1.p1 TRINITY_DN1843_c0_g1~~TRINITY_DN1843_c0_g1_i1.p1  ORF type:complete len:451 (+),score=44.71 TRINITY_DN1843_c0_g1_i1:109-1353(+)